MKRFIRAIRIMVISTVFLTIYSISSGASLMFFDAVNYQKLAELSLYLQMNMGMEYEVEDFAVEYSNGVNEDGRKKLDCIKKNIILNITYKDGFRTGTGIRCTLPQSKETSNYFPRPSFYRIEAPSWISGSANQGHYYYSLSRMSEDEFLDSDILQYHYNACTLKGLEENNPFLHCVTPNLVNIFIQLKTAYLDSKKYRAYFLTRAVSGYTQEAIPDSDEVLEYAPYCWTEFFSCRK